MTRDSLHDSCYFPPPWNVYEFPEKTEGWIEFQKYLRKDPVYYLGVFEERWWNYNKCRERI